LPSAPVAKSAIAMEPVRPGVRNYFPGPEHWLKIGAASPFHLCAWVTGHLMRLELLGYFNCIQAADDVRFTKPYPDLYLQALEGLGVRPAEAIALEDSPNGVQAARRAGLFCVAVPNQITRRLALDQADLQLESLADLSLDELIAIAGQA
jgi:beta-phosphoglucomutase-like phosphatase (HAD superfamily)